MRTRPLTQKAWRIKAGLSQVQLATKLSVSQQTISNWETLDEARRRRPDVDDLVRIEKLTKGEVTALSYTLDFMRACPSYAETK